MRDRIKRAEDQEDLSQMDRSGDQDDPVFERNYYYDEVLAVSEDYVRLLIESGYAVNQQLPSITAEFP